MHQFWDRQAPVLGLSGTSFGISHLFLGYKKEPKLWHEGCFRVFKGVLELPYVNICHISSHSNHVNHPFKCSFYQLCWASNPWFTGKGFGFNPEADLDGDGIPDGEETGKEFLVRSGDDVDDDDDD